MRLNSALEVERLPAEMTLSLIRLWKTSCTPQIPKARIRNPIRITATHDLAKALNNAIMAGRLPVGLRVEAPGV